MILVRILAVALLQIAAIGAMIWERMQILNDGREVTLNVEPVDPTDLFRGDYVILTYEISRITDFPPENGTGPWRPGDLIYVTLEGEQDRWRAGLVSHDPPLTDIGPMIRGRIGYVERDWTTATEAWADEGQPGFSPPAEQKPAHLCEGGCPTTLHMSYGIESYFIPQGEGRAIENIRNDGRVSIRVALAADGRAAIKGLMIDGEPVYEETLF